MGNIDAALTLVVPLPDSELDEMTAMDFSEDAEYLAIVAMDLSVLIVPLLDLLCLCVPAWEETVNANRSRRRAPKIIPRERSTLEMVSDLFVGNNPWEAVDSSAVRFRLASSEPGLPNTITSVIWWTCGPRDGGEEAVPEQ